MIALSLQQFFGIFGEQTHQAVDGTYADRYDRQIICALSRAFRPRRFLEIGVNEGRTAELVLRVSPWICHYLGVDVLPNHIPTLDQQKSEVPQADQCARFVRDDRFELLQIAGGTANLHASDLGSPCDFVYVDADHSYEGVHRDTDLARDILPAAGGVIVWHDYHRSLPGVVRYLDESVMLGRRMVHVCDSRIVFEVVR